MSTAAQTPAPPALELDYWDGVKTVYGLEMRQRLRSKGWYIMLAVWFIVIGIVSALAALTSGIGRDDFGGVGTEDVFGSTLFELVIGFVLFFGLLVAPALSANAVNGDRAGGTLAILQVTLLKPGQLLWGKWLAAWVASLGFLLVSIPFIIWALSFGSVPPLTAVVFLVMLAVELGLVCAIGLGVSALANRPLFSIVISYMLVALLAIGTLIGFGLSLQLVKDTVRANYPQWPGYNYEELSSAEQNAIDVAPYDPNGYTCMGPLEDRTVFRTERVAWLLAANPFVVVSDAVPRTKPADDAGFGPTGVMSGISMSVRAAQAGPEYSEQCLGGVKNTDAVPDQVPVWPLGLAIQGVLAGVLIWRGRRRLVTPAGRLAAGTRIA